MITIQRVEYDQKSSLRNLLELYKYDFSDFEPDDVNENGLYEYRYLDHYWTEEGRHPFFIRVDGKLAGLALIREIGTKDNQKIFSMAEFFVMKKYRKRGVGQSVSNELFNTFRGKWKIAQVEENTPAQIFWRKTIDRYTNNNYKEIREDGWEGPIQTFLTATQ
ncbi:GNAT family N-acetyltransferase [Paenibacillus sp. PAMC21692]|uniref:GNAT family N-acetyltransferase n=1 Tax=Paenibacillus sp. PAMC21692 TaxID=2762320 RepID=UPI00164E6009|nr:GNAT family N-acetyltransferase [Paenibacillus sp. PAMC21692]QNK55135.1 GNAT family N-acetyltransferase [Paenibacillus sp. PAMC21692]